MASVDEPAAAGRPFLGTGERPSVAVHSVLYNTDRGSVLRALESLARSAELAVMEDGVAARVAVRFGDCSPGRVLEDVDVQAILEDYGWILDFRYIWFGENLGSARAHNRLAEEGDEDVLFFLNPDVVVTPRLVQLLLEPFHHAGVGMTEAKQLPIEHPKDYDRVTGDTSWAATACAAMPMELFRKLDGFDDETFFLYCDDVDLSWRVRLAGLRVVHQPAAVVLHDKRVDREGVWISGTSERYYSAEAALLLAHKWSRPDLVSAILDAFDGSGETSQIEAAAAFRARQAAETLPPAIDPDHRVGQFVNGAYAVHRFSQVER